MCYYYSSVIYFDLLAIGAFNLTPYIVGGNMKVCPLFARLGCWTCIALFLTSCSLSSPAANGSPTALPEYWPTSTWRTSSPEQQGMDSAKLVAMLTEIQDKHYPIHGLVIIRNGYLVFEMYTPPFQVTSRHYIASATKSF
ncbi:MAG TPA: hypothetical protein VK206_21345, partial [Anaerolineales bacterium]|nr:hypothetical protein [Anaerolineales bacterium]